MGYKISKCQQKQHLSVNFIHRTLISNQGPTKMKGSLIILMTLIITITCDRARVDPGKARLEARDSSSVGRIDAGDARAAGRIDALDASAVGRIDDYLQVQSAELMLEMAPQSAELMLKMQEQSAEVMLEMQEHLELKVPTAC